MLLNDIQSAHSIRHQAQTNDTPPNLDVTRDAAPDLVDEEEMEEMKEMEEALAASKSLLPQAPQSSTEVFIFCRRLHACVKLFVLSITAVDTFTNWIHKYHDVHYRLDFVKQPEWDEKPEQVTLDEVLKDGSRFQKTHN